MQPPQSVTLTRDVTAAAVPVGTPVTLHAGQEARITQALGGSYTVVVHGNMYRIEGKDADALGIAPGASSPAFPPTDGSAGTPRTKDEVEREVWESLKTCYDPEIPVNIVDLGLVYDVSVAPCKPDTFRVEVKMTLTAPGCGMGPVIQQEAEDKLRYLQGVEEAQVDLVWDPPWNQAMLTDAAKLELGLM
ncbi:MAG: putative Fe-S cluster assembly protein SufT [Verrucomicrobiales bacterium]|nr:putative Fe-S cluster assembly protein SufT [Verrucomicrobiales bacterium]